MEVAGRTRILLLLSRIKAIAQRKSMESQTELKMPNSPLWLPRFLSYRPETALTTVQMYLNSTVLFVFHSPLNLKQSHL